MMGVKAWVMGQDNGYPRGSEWREWDLHVHTPASFHWQGEKFGGDEVKNDALVDALIDAANRASSAAFAIMDYWTFRGWFELKKRLADQKAPKLEKTIFPGIELRLTAPMDGRLNAHVIFSNHINDQYLIDFRSKLRVALINQPLSDNALIEYARYANEDKLVHHGYKRADILGDANLALDCGSQIAEISCESYKEAIAQVPDGLAVGFMPWSTNDGLDRVKWAEHYAYALGLFESSPIFETRNVDYWAAFAGLETPGNRKWLSNFQEALRDLPRLAVAGSDAHRLKGVVGDNEKRGYGDFPSGKKTWIKADPTWKGLQQAIKEPAKRSFLGDVPPKVEVVRQNKTFYIDSVRVEKDAGCSISQKWLDGTNVPLNHDLIAIIGNKGSGKSALADVIALLGNSQQRNHFSFLRKDRFRGKSGEPAKHFVGTLNWLAGQPGTMPLSENPTADKVELVKYIPQGRFEDLCNEHVSGRSASFEKELRTVIFSHVDAATRLDALDFDQLIEHQEKNFRAKLNEFRKTLHSANEQIVSIETQLHPDVRKNLEEQIRLKTKQLEEHALTKPVEVAAPAGTLTDEQSSANERLKQIDVGLVALVADEKSDAIDRQSLGRKQRSIENITHRLAILEGQLKEFQTATGADLATLDIPPVAILKFQINRKPLSKISAEITENVGKLQEAGVAQATQRGDLEEERTLLAAKLNEPQQQHQKYLIDVHNWQSGLEKIIGSDSEPESKTGLEARLKQIEELPGLLKTKRKERQTLARNIFQVLCSQRDARANLFSPLQEVIAKNVLIREEYKLQFQANLYGSPEAISSYLFDMIKRNVGELRGEDESIAAIRVRFEKYNFASADDAAQFTSDMWELLENAASQLQPGVEGIASLLRKDRNAVDVYDFLYGLGYMEPKYTLLFQDTAIEQLSPGQRGALLLIFYLLVDKGRNPIVLDQPEENLDNETVVSLLVPVLNEAKRRDRFLWSRIIRIWR